MTQVDWQGVMPAITTPFDESGAVDHGFLAEHAGWMVDAGCTGIVPFGSLGEGATLEESERESMLDTLVGAVGDRVPVIPAISALGTRTAIRLTEMAAARGARGVMVLPPYVHKGPWREIEAHFAAIFEATDLPCMLYNNPIAYGIDVLPEQIADLAEAYPNLVAVKDSGGDHRRITAVKALVGDRLALFAGLDDMAVEAVACGAVGWVAGLVNAMPEESVRVFQAARDGRWNEAWSLYHWFLPLLRLDTVPEFVQLIKLVQQEVGRGSERVRLPRMPVRGAMRNDALKVVRDAIAKREEIVR